MGGQPSGTTTWWQRTWLSADGSLTSRLGLLGPVKVHVQYQGSRSLWPSERQALRSRSGHVREVILSVDGQAMVWARSATTHRGLKGPWKALKGLGSRPLAELLFNHNRVRREEIHRHRWRKHGPEQRRAARQWADGNCSAPYSAVRLAPPGPARASVFWHQGQPLRVMESFTRQLARWTTPD